MPCLKVRRPLIPSNSGFTLIELMVVVAIIGILSSIAVPRFGQTLARAKYARMVADVITIRTVAFGAYADNSGLWPLDEVPSVRPVELTAYLKSWPTPPCPGWMYDWDNWTGPVLGLPVGESVVRLTVRAANIDTVATDCIVPSATWGGCNSPTEVAAGVQDYRNLSPKKIDCTEDSGVSG